MEDIAVQQIFMNNSPTFVMVNVLPSTNNVLGVVEYVLRIGIPVDKAVFLKMKFKITESVAQHVRAPEYHVLYHWVQMVVK